MDSLLIKPAGPDCNIDCTYCFYKCKAEMFEDVSHRMSDETVEALVSKFLAQGAGNFTFIFQGGEPTLCGVEFYRNFVATVNKYKKFNQNVNYSLQTNGVLINDEFAKFLGENKFLIGLSIDGPLDINDYYRIDYGEKGTGEKTLNAAKLFEKYNVEYNTLSVITNKNVGRSKDIFNFLKENGSGYMQFIPCLEFDENKKVKDFCMTPEEYGDFLCDMFDIWYNNGRPDTYIRFFEETLISYVAYRGANCSQMSQCIAAPVVEHNGSVYPCDFFVEPELLMGNIKDIDFKDIESNDLFLDFKESKWTKVNDECKKCKWKGICFGDCCKNRTAVNEKSYFCLSYIKFYEYSNEKFLELKKYAISINKELEQYGKSVGRNDKCLCGSLDKFKNCCYKTKG